MNPKINIKYGRLIDPYFKEFVRVNYPDYVFPEEKDVLAKAGVFKEAWGKYENKFFEGLDKLDFKYKRNQIDVFIVTATNRDMSSPLIIRSRYDEKEFVNVLIHELLHALFVDNKFKQEYKEESQRIINHVYVFALLTYLFKDVFKEEDRLEVERSKSSPDNNQEYFRAWEIVDRDGYKEILENIKK